MPHRGFLWIPLFCATGLSVLTGEAAAQSSSSSSPQPPAFDDYDRFFLSGSASYGQFQLRTCAQAKGKATQKNCNDKAKTFYGDNWDGGYQQFLASRLSRLQGEIMSRLVQEPLNNDAAALQAAKEATEECNRGNQRRCVELGVLTLKGWGVPRNQQRGDLLFRKACAAGETEGCGYLAIGYERNYPKDAAELFSKACFSGQGESYACERLAALHEQGRGVPKDLALAAALYKRRCEVWNNDASRCEQWTRISKLGVPPMDIASRFPPPPANESSP